MKTNSARILVAVIAAGLGSAFLAAPAQAAAQPMGSGITLDTQIEVDGAIVPYNRPLPIGHEATMVFTWANSGGDDVTVRTIDSRLNFATSVVSFNKTGVGATGTMQCDNPDLNGPLGAVMHPSDVVVCRSSTFTIPADAANGGGVAGWDSVGGRTFAWMSDSVWIAGSIGLEASNGAVWRDGEPVTEAAVGDQLVYTFDVTNTGEEVLGLTASDALGLGYTCAEPTLAWNATIACTSAPYTVTDADAAAGAVVNPEGTAVGDADVLGAATDTTPLPSVVVPAAEPEPTPEVPGTEPTSDVTPETAGSTSPDEKASPDPDLTTPATIAAPKGGALAATGSSAAIVSASALGLVTLGGLALWAARRRAHTS